MLKILVPFFFFTSKIVYDLFIAIYYGYCLTVFLLDERRDRGDGSLSGPKVQACFMVCQRQCRTTVHLTLVQDCLGGKDPMLAITQSCCCYICLKCYSTQNRRHA